MTSPGVRMAAHGTSSRSKLATNSSTVICAAASSVSERNVSRFARNALVVEKRSSRTNSGRPIARMMPWTCCCVTAATAALPSFNRIIR